MWTLEVAFSKYIHTASKGGLIIYKYFIITDVNLQSLLLFACRYVCMCVIYVHVYVSAPGHVSASVCAQMHMCACAWGHSKIGCDVYFAFCDRISHWAWAHWLGKASWLLSPQESTYLNLLRAGLTSPQDQVCLLSWVLGSNLGPHACKAHTLLTDLSPCPPFFKPGITQVFNFALSINVTLSFC